ncbi:hypothetical protein ACHQM5_005606 [Ranunculus cassubicifolius]
MISAISSSDVSLMREGAAEIEDLANQGNPHAQSTLGFLYGTGQLRDTSAAKAFLHHHFAI